MNDINSETKVLNKSKAAKYNNHISEENQRTQKSIKEEQVKGNQIISHHWRT